MKILALKNGDESYFDELALSYGSVFNTIKWTNIFDRHAQRYGIYDKNGYVIGGFTTYMEKRTCLSVYRNPPFTPEIGPFLKIEASNPVSVMDTWKRSLSLMAEFIEELPYSIILISFNKDIIDMQPFSWKKFKVTPKYTYVVDLSSPVETLWSNMSNERRKNITRGTRDNLSVRRVTDMELVRSLVLKTYSRQQKEVNEFYLNKILFDFAGDDNSFAFVTFRDDKAIACSFCIYDSKTAYYLLGGYDDDNKHHGGGTLSMWEAIRYARKKELLHFDFEGSMLPPVEKYFRGFGGKLTPYYTVSKAKLPLELLLKFYKRALF
ncbi:MAG: GNAT family N-acetyltransferase [Nitrospirae bacterium]|nr:GNAT family N-acetyltransferase [Nitrospirota bacterium]